VVEERSDDTTGPPRNALHPGWDARTDGPADDWARWRGSSAIPAGIGGAGGQTGGVAPLNPRLSAAIPAGWRKGKRMAGRNPVGADFGWGPPTQGGRVAPTLGYGAQPLQGCPESPSPFPRKRVSSPPTSKRLRLCTNLPLSRRNPPKAFGDGSGPAWDRRATWRPSPTPGLPTRHRSVIHHGWE